MEGSKFLRQEQKSETSGVQIQMQNAQRQPVLYSKRAKIKRRKYVPHDGMGVYNGLAPVDNPSVDV